MEEKPSPDFDGQPPQQPPKSSSGPGAGLVILFVVLGVMAVGTCACLPISVALLLPAVQSAREAARTVQSSNNLRQIGIALHSYHASYGRFPPAYLADEDGRPMTSWRTLILPHLEQQRLYDKYDETKPWDDPANATVRETAIEIYRSPRDPQDDSLLTNYLAVTGERAMFPGSEGRQLSDVRDGMSSTIMVVEVLNSDVQWSEPRDLDMNNYRRVAEGADPAATNVIPHRGVVLFADGSVHRLNENVTREMLRMYFTAAGGERAPPWPSQ